MQEESRKDETDKRNGGKQERKNEKVKGTEYVLRPRQDEDREEMQPGRKLGGQSQVRF